MRHNDARKWLHAGLDLLPLILIPVFMIYSHRHTIEGGSISVPYNKVVDFNQLFNFREYQSQSVISSFSNDLVNFVIDNQGGESSFRVSENFTYNKGDKLYLRVDPNIFTEQDVSFQLFFNDPSNGYPFLNVNQYDVLFSISNIPSNNVYVGCQIPGNYQVTCSFYCNVFNFTQMFGSGNEPTIQQFNNWYSNDYYDYTLSSKQLLKGYSEVTYDDNDIMSQFTYQLYNSVDKYFNMGNVFNLGGVYDWFNLNIFGGNAPIAVYIVWQVVLYEFVMDLLFLLYGLFMWFIDMMKHLMEKPFRSIK